MFKKGFIAGLLMLSISGFVQAQGLSPSEIDRIAPSVVMIVALQNGEPFSQGSGTIVDSSGVIFTNRHVIEGADDLAILMLDDPNEQPVVSYYASEIATFETLDFSVIQIDRDRNGNVVLPTALNLPAISLAQRDAVRGEQLYIFGYPGTGDGYLVVTSGLVTTVQNGDINGTRQPVWYQTDAEISPGNSGGLAISLDGELIGIPTTVRSESETLGRLGGILPFRAVDALYQAGTGIVRVTGTGGNNTTGTNDSTSISTSTTGVPFTCDGVQINNGVEIVVNQMRPGFTYKATVLGLGDFDPVLYIGETANRQQGLCNDDSTNASNVAVNLGLFEEIVYANNLSSHLSFSHSNRDMTDISFIVGSVNSTPGEFILILEGMAVTSGDGDGDPFSVYVTDGMVQHGGFFMVAQMGIERQLDPFFQAVDNDFNLVSDTSGVRLACDDGATEYCNSSSLSLAGSQLRTADGYVYNGDEFDAALLVDPSSIPNPTTFLFSSSNKASTGNYLLMFVFGTQ